METKPRGRRKAWDCRSGRWVTALVVLTVGVAAACEATSYQVQRSALVPAPTPPVWSGRPRPLGVSLGSQTVVWSRPPTVAPESGVGLYVSRVSLDANLHLRLGDHVELWMPISYGLSEASFATPGAALECPAGGVFTGAGLGGAASFYLLEGWYLGLSLELVLSAIPSRIRAVPTTGLRHEWDESEIMPIVRGGLVTGYDFQWWRLFVSLYVRNHPTNLGSSFETVVEHSDIDPELSFGGAFMIVGLGAEFDLSPNVSLLLHAFEPFALSGVEIVYAPILGLTLDAHDDH